MIQWEEIFNMYDLLITNQIINLFIYIPKEVRSFKMSNIYSIWGIKVIFWIINFGKVHFKSFSFFFQGGLVQVRQMLRRTTYTWPMPFYATPITFAFMALLRFIMQIFAIFLLLFSHFDSTFCYKCWEI